MLHLLVWVGLYILFQLVTNNRLKECLKVLKVLPVPFPQHTSSKNRLSQKFLATMEKHSSSKIQCYCIIISTGLKEAR